MRSPPARARADYLLKDHMCTWGNQVPPSPRPWEGEALTQGSGETGFPQTPTRWEGLGGRSPHAGVWGNRVSPDPHPVGGFGKGYALPGTTLMFIAVLCGGAAWTSNVNIGSRRGALGNRVSPSLSGRGPEARAPRPRPLGGFGRAQPSQEQPYVHCGVVRRSRMDG